MTKPKTIKIILSLMSIIAGLTTSYFVGKILTDQQSPTPIAPPLAESNIVNASENALSKTEVTSQISPDGTKNLVMKTTQSKNSASIEFTTTDEGGLNPTKIFSTSATNSEEYKVPFNAWSPDDKYVFILKNGNALVFRADGKPIVEKGLYLDISTTFAKKIEGFVYEETTGWASDTLLIVNATNQDSNVNRASYWFEVPSESIIRLSSLY